jgi:hypothetical protein
VCVLRCVRRYSVCTIFRGVSGTPGLLLPLPLQSPAMVSVFDTASMFVQALLPRGRRCRRQRRRRLQTSLGQLVSHNGRLFAPSSQLPPSPLPLVVARAFTF